jgi:hypothetical protein
MKKSQMEQIYDLLRSGRPVRTDEIMREVYGNDHLGLARVGARVWDVKKKYKVEVKGWKDEQNPTLYWYQIKTPIVNSQNVNCKPIVTKPGVPQPLFDLPPKSTARLWMS